MEHAPACTIGQVLLLVFNIFKYFHLQQYFYCYIAALIEHSSMLLTSLNFFIKSLNRTKTRNGLENGLINGLSQIVWKATCITVQLF